MTNNLERRISEHKSGFDRQCYTFSRRPVKLVFHEVFQNPSDAIRFEKQLKGWSRKKKEALINKEWHSLIEYSKSKGHPSIPKKLGTSTLRVTKKPGHTELVEV